MTFEFDPAKSAANKAKHGIDFAAAQVLWLDDRKIAIASDYVREERLVVIGRIGNRLWAAAVTLRGDATRIISVRRARVKEELLYESQGD